METILFFFFSCERNIYIYFRSSEISRLLFEFSFHFLDYSLSLIRSYLPKVEREYYAR